MMIICTITLTLFRHHKSTLNGHCFNSHNRCCEAATTTTATNRRFKNTVFYRIFYSSIANNSIESFFNPFTTKVRKHSLHVLNALYRNVLRAGLVVEHFNRNPTLVL